MAATLTDAAGYRLARWLEFGGKSENPGLVSAVFIERRVELRTNSSFGLSEWLSPTVKKRLIFR
ncbi:MAG: hypothetical protein WBO16_11080 [Gammaproteobacteria bacterium]|jgi:hypothetical protein